MILKDELEILRGEPIEVFDRSPMDVPCIETSDAERLCKRPVVSVCMTTYNHESYIRRSIEGVMMQKTDFEFELVIGEDCSQDKTREICFEYQKKFPDKVRVLWWHENVSCTGGNGRRVRAHCRGEFVALCEGDDFWIDHYKLQKQVALMREYPRAGICFGAVRVLHENTGVVKDPDTRILRSGVQDGVDFMRSILLEQRPVGREILQTSGNLIRKSVMDEAQNKYEIFSWRLLVGDITGWLAYASLSDVCYLPDVVSTYRINSGGVTRRRFAEVMRDGDSVLYYFLRKVLNYSKEEALRWTAKRFVRMWVNKAAVLKGKEQRDIASEIEGNTLLRQIFHRPYSWFMLQAIKLGLLTPSRAFWLNRVFWYLPRLGLPWPVRAVNM